MKYITVWRIEGSNTRGMYCSNGRGETPWRRAAGYHSESRHPCPEDDLVDGTRNLYDVWYEAASQTQYGISLWKFGFRSLTQARKWINTPTLRNGLARVGMRLNRYRIPAELCVVSNHQVVFVFNQATLIETRSPARL